MNSQTNGTGTRTPQVMMEMDLLREKLGKLRELLDVLETRLEPVTMIAEPALSNNKAEIMPRRVPLAFAIHELADTTEQLFSRIENSLERLEI